MSIQIIDYWDIKREWDTWYYQSEYRDNFISFNGQGCAGKTTNAVKLAKQGVGEYIYTFKLRDEIPDYLKDDTFRDIRDIVFPWLAVDFHWRMKPLVRQGKCLIFDHYLGDIWIGTGANDVDSMRKTIYHLEMPYYNNGIHFYLDLPYDAYRHRLSIIGKKRLETTKEEHYERNRNKYLRLCDAEKLVYIDGNKSEKEVFDIIKKHLARRGIGGK